MPTDPTRNINLAPSVKSVTGGFYGERKPLEYPPVERTDDEVFLGIADKAAEGYFPYQTERNPELNAIKRIIEAEDEPEARLAIERLTTDGISAGLGRGDVPIDNEYLLRDVPGERATEQMKDVYDGNFLEWMATNLGLTDDGEGMERLRARTKDALANLQARGYPQEQLQKLRQNWELAQSAPAKLAEKMHRRDRLQMYAQIEEDAHWTQSLSQGVQAFFISDAYDDEKYASAFAAIAAPELFAGKGLLGVAGRAVVGGVMEGAAIAPSSFARARLRRELALADGEVQAELDKYTREAIDDVLLGAAFGAGANVALEGLGAAVRGGRGLFRSGVDRYKAMSREKPRVVPVAAQMSPTPGGRAPLRLVEVKGDKPIGGARAFRKVAADAETKGVVEVVPARPKYISAKQMDAFEADIEKEVSAAEFDGYDYVAEIDGDRVYGLNPRAEEPPAAVTTEQAKAREAEFRREIPQAESHHKVADLVPVAKGAKAEFLIGGRGFANKLAARKSANIADDAYNVQRASGLGLKSPEEVFAVRDGRVVFRADIDGGMIEKFRGGYATKRPALPVAKTGETIVRPSGGAAVKGSDLADPTPDGAAQQAGDILSENTRNSATDLPEPPPQPAAYTPPESAVGVFGEEAAARLTNQYADRAPAFWRIVEDARAGGAPLDKTTQTEDFLDYALRNSYDAPEGVEIYTKLKQVANDLPDAALREAADKKRALSLLEKGKTPEQVSDIMGGVLKGSGAKLTDTGRPQGENTEGKPATRKDKRVVQGDKAAITQTAKKPKRKLKKRKVGELKLTRAQRQFVNDVRSDKPPPPRTATEKEREQIKKQRPFITYLLTGGQSITDRRAFQGAKWRGLRLPEKTKFGRGSKTNRGFGELGIDIERLRKANPGLINNKEGMTLEQMTDHLEDGGKLRDIIEWNFPQVLDQDGNLNFGALEDGEFTIWRTGLEADMSGERLLDEAEEALVYGTREQQHYDYERTEFLRSVGYEAADARTGTREMLMRQNTMPADATDAQIVAAAKRWRKEEEKTRNMLTQMHNEGVDFWRYYDEKKEAIDGILARHGYRKEDGGDWVNKNNPEDRFSPYASHGYRPITRAVLELIGNKRGTGADGVAHELAENNQGWTTTGAYQDTAKATRAAATEKPVLQTQEKSKQDPTPGRTGNKEIPPLKNQDRRGNGILSDEQGRPLTQREGEDPLFGTGDDDDGSVWRMGALRVDRDETGGFSLWNGGDRVMSGADGRDVYNRVARLMSPDDMHSARMMDLYDICLRGLKK